MEQRSLFKNESLETSYDQAVKHSSKHQLRGSVTRSTAS